MFPECSLSVCSLCVLCLSVLCLSVLCLSVCSLSVCVFAEGSLSECSLSVCSLSVLCLCRTRALFVEFSVYNTNSNLLAVLTFLLEFPVSEHVQASLDLKTCRLHRLSQGLDLPLLLTVNHPRRARHTNPHTNHNNPMPSRVGTPSLSHITSSMSQGTLPPLPPSTI